MGDVLETKVWERMSALIFVPLQLHRHFLHCSAHYYRLLFLVHLMLEGYSIMCIFVCGLGIVVLNYVATTYYLGMCTVKYVFPSLIKYILTFNAFLIWCSFLLVSSFLLAAQNYFLTVFFFWTGLLRFLTPLL